jgi:RNA polymerase sigma-70 factor (ECF subfamily)
MAGQRRSRGWARSADHKVPTNLEAELGLLLERGELASAATLLIRGYGPELLGYMTTILRDRDWARDVFSQFCENVWRGLPGFRRDSSVRTWCYVLAWNACSRFGQDSYRKRVRRLETSEVEHLAREITSTPLRLQRDRAAGLRAQLTPYEQTLLILRVDRELAWDEVARVLSTTDQTTTEETLRKRFERIKARLRMLAETEPADPTATPVPGALAPADERRRR